MAGVSEPPFRRICRGLGADVLITEFLNSEGLRRRIARVLEGCEFDEIERPVGIQIYGADPRSMAEAAALVTEHYQPDFIDINFGCPVKKVVQRNGGSGCLRDMNLVDQIIRACVAATHLPISVKTRSGWSEEARDPVGIALLMQDAGAQAFTLHARTRTQMFNGKANWDDIAVVVEALDIPVIGNGDINTADDALRMQQHTGCAGLMIGRGSFGNPWLFGRAQRLLDGQDPGPEPTVRERIETAIAHLHDLARKRGDYAATLMRKHVAWYVRGLYDNSALCREINHSKTPAETEQLLRHYLERLESMPAPYAHAAGDAFDADDVEMNGSCASP
jgi:nifR3 family TIM-barrel protein